MHCPVKAQVFPPWQESLGTSFWPSSHRAAIQVYVKPGSAWVPTRVKIIGKTFWKKIKSNYFLSISRLRHFRPTSYSSFTQVNGKDHSLLKQRAFAELRQGIWSMFLSRTGEDWPCFILKLPPWFGAPSVKKSWLQETLMTEIPLLYSFAQSLALIENVELFLCWHKCHLIYWTQVKLVDVVILLKTMSECVCPRELKTLAHVFGRFPYLNRKWFKTFAVCSEIFRIQTQLKDKYANTLPNTIFSWSKYQNNF